MDFALFAVTVVSVSLSGVLAPGPLLAVTLAEGKKNRFAGIEISAGHAIIEMPIIVMLYLFGSLATLGIEKSFIAFAGGMLMLYLAYREIKAEKTGEYRIKGILSGILMSMLNPYFIVWWLTIGFTLVLLSLNFGALGVIAFVILHESCDFGWYGFVSLFSNRLSERKGFEKTLSLISAIILITFGIYFIYTSLKTLILYYYS